MSKATKTLVEQIVGAGFKEQNAKGEAVTGTDFAHGWNSLDGRKKHLYLAHKSGKRVEMELVNNGAGEPLKRIALIDGDTELLVTTEGVVHDVKLLDEFLAK